MKDDLTRWLKAEMDAEEAAKIAELGHEAHARALGNHDRALYHSQIGHYHNIRWNTLYKVMLHISSG